MPQPPSSVSFIARYTWMADKAAPATAAAHAIRPLVSEPDIQPRYPGSAEREPQARGDRLTLSPQAQMIRSLQMRDRQVRAHEAAHAAAGGAHAGHPTYTLQQGPDGRSYAIGGEVSISTSEIPNDPQATLEKAQTVRRAALAPADPSAADRAIAAKAMQTALKARREIAVQQDETGTFAASWRNETERDDAPPTGTRLNLRA